MYFRLHVSYTIAISIDCAAHLLPSYYSCLYYSTAVALTAQLNAQDGELTDKAGDIVATRSKGNIVGVVLDSHSGRKLGLFDDAECFATTTFLYTEYLLYLAGTPTNYLVEIDGVEHPGVVTPGVVTHEIMTGVDEQGEEEITFHYYQDIRTGEPHKEYEMACSEGGEDNGEPNCCIMDVSPPPPPTPPPTPTPPLLFSYADFTFTLWTSIDLRLSYRHQQQFCEWRGMQLCPLERICPNRDDVSANARLSFVFPGGGDAWVAYNIDNDPDDGCTGVGVEDSYCQAQYNLWGSPNRWVQIGTGHSLCKTHCEVANGNCPGWGYSRLREYLPEYAVCCYP